MKCRKIFALLLALLLVLGMTACSGKNENAKLVGTWVYDSTLVNGKPMDSDTESDAEGDTESSTESSTESDTESTTSGKEDKEDQEDAKLIFQFRKNGRGERRIGDVKIFTFDYEYDGEVCLLKNVINANGTIGTSGEFLISVDGDRMTIHTQDEEETVEILFVKQ